MSEHAASVIIPLHLLALLGLFFFDPIWLIATFIGWVLISGLGVSVGLHRYFSHGAFKVSPFWHKVLCIAGCLGAQGSPIFWAALHRGKHHRHADDEQDPHTPRKGWWHAYFGWQFTLEAKEVPMRAAHDLMRDEFLMRLHKHYYKVVWGGVLVAALIHPMLALYGLVIPMVISMHEENLVNVVCHTRWLGYRLYETRDDSVNNPLLGWFAWGQGFHNNHHAQPATFDFGRRWWEIDPSVWIVRLIARRGNRRMPGDFSAAGGSGSSS